jgi:hypothetical protein
MQPVSELRVVLHYVPRVKLLNKLHHYHQQRPIQRHPYWDIYNFLRLCSVAHTNKK